MAFRYEYSFAVAAVVAILHDVAMTGGLFFLSGRTERSAVAAALTTIGFSINDTIVIFDRIRENLRMGTRGSFQRCDEYGAEPNVKPGNYYIAPLCLPPLRCISLAACN